MAGDANQPPRSLALLWGHEEPRRPGPKPSLSLEDITAAAIAVADAEGLAAVAMGRVAAKLGFTTMALYRYVSGKDDLVALMVDAAIGPPLRPSAADEGWRAGLVRWSLDYLAALRRHPWITRVPISGPPLAPNGVAWMDAALRVLAATALSAQEKLSVLLLLSNYVRSAGQLAADLAEAERARPAEQPAVMRRYGQLLSTLIDADHFPALREIIAAGALDDDDDADVEVAFGLKLLLDGVAVLVEERGQRVVDERAAAATVRQGPCREGV